MFSYRGFEYILPGIFKAYPRAYADDFMKRGIVYFTNLNVFKKEEDEERGDPMEGTGRSIHNDTVYSVHFRGNPIFVWCSTLETQKEEILNTWQDRDTVIEIYDRLKFIDRIIEAGRKHGLASGSSHIGPVTYDKNTGSRRTGQIVDGLFQKNMRYQHQKEFRFVICGVRELTDKNELILELGDCGDIARIV